MASSARRIRRTIAVALCAGLVAAGCGDDDGERAGSPQAAPTTTEAAEVESGGSLTLALLLNPAGMDPIHATSMTAAGPNHYFVAVYDALAYVDSTTGEVVPQIAESIEPNDDGTVWTVTLRDGVTFSDGTPFDAEAVKFNWERIADPENKSANMAVAQRITSIEVVSPLVLEATLGEPNLFFDRTIANELTFVGSPTAIREKGARFAEEPVGAGPFLFDSWVRDSHMTFTRNPDYWQEGLPRLDELTIKVIADGSQRYNSLVTGDIDVAFVSSNYEMVLQAEAKGMPVVRVGAGGHLPIMFNVTRPPFDDPVAREAIALAIDRDQLNQVASSGALPPSTHLYEPEHPFYDEDAQLHTHDPVRAQELFDEYAQAHGGPLRFTLLSSDGQLAVMEALQAQLTAYDNVSMDLTPMPGIQVVERALAKDFEATIAYAPTLLDPEPDLSNLLHSQGSRNYMGYASPAMDAALEAGRSTRDTAERAKAYATVQATMIEDIPWTIIRPYVQMFVMDEDVRGFSTMGTGVVNWAEVGRAV
jgi:peptide/nickel transport system substrate-binding protein